MVTPFMQSVGICVVLALGSLNAFAPPRPFHSNVARVPSSLNVMPPQIAESMPSTHVAFADATNFAGTPQLVASVGEILGNVAVGVAGIVAVLVAITVLFASFIIPQAATQLEEQVKAKDPGLWLEYENRLEPGETLAMRPDLMKELGDKMQQITIAEFDAMQEQAQKKDDVLDVEVSEVEGDSRAGR